MCNLYERLTAAMDESERRQESINQHTEQEPGSGMESAHVIIKLLDAKVLARLVAEVLAIARTGELPDEESADEVTRIWAEGWRSEIYPPEETHAQVR